MAGHSHAKNVKRKKEAGDKKRATAFSKISRLIISATREGGKDPQSNPSLRLAIEKAKEADMPKENITRSIKRGAGEGEEGKLEPFLFEAYGPENVAIIIEGFTDNRNRTLSDIKEILKRYGGKLADPGSVKWLFSPKGLIEIEKEQMGEKMLLQLIEDGAEDIEEKNETTIIYTSPENIEKAKSFLLKKDKKIVSAHPGWKAKNFIDIKGDLHEKLLEEIENNDSVEEVYINTLL